MSLVQTTELPEAGVSNLPYPRTQRPKCDSQAGTASDRQEWHLAVGQLLQIMRSYADLRPESQAS